MFCGSTFFALTPRILHVYPPDTLAVYDALFDAIICFLGLQQHLS